MASKIFGEIYNPRKEVSIEWRIDDYFSIPQKADSYIESPTFHCLNASWNLRLYPNGRRKHESVEYLDLLLYLTNKNPEIESISGNFVLGIKSSNGVTYKRDSYCSNFEQNIGYGTKMFLKRNELLKNKHQIAPDGTVTVFFLMKQSCYVSHASSQTASINGSLYRDFSNLLHNKHKSDVVIKLKSREFQAHKLILGARSSVFAAMFKYDMKENVSGVVNLEDYDPDAFYEFLLFIYTGQIKELSPQNALQLFTLADMYDVGELKSKCLDFMKDNLTLDIACDVVAIADRHGEAELKNLAKRLIVGNMKALISTQKWITFMRENSNLAAELLMVVIPDNTTESRGRMYRPTSLQILNKELK